MTQRYRRRKGKLTHDEVISLYKGGKSCREIALEDGTSQVSVLLLLTRHGVPRRPPGSAGRSSDHIWTKHGLCSEARRLNMVPFTYARLKAVIFLGGKCAKCGIGDFRVLEINHIPRKKWKLKFTDLVRVLQGETSGVEILCANCNVIYEFEMGRRVPPPIDFFNQVIHATS